MNINVYGALLNTSFRFYDPRVGQSVTLTGRVITKHMSAKTNQLIAGAYDYKGASIIYNDTDSCSNDTLIVTNNGLKTIEELYLDSAEKWVNKDKEYSYNPNLQVLSYDPEKEESYYGHINYIYRHKVSKEKWEIEDEDGNTVTITGDHSIMVERNNELIEVKPRDLLDTDVLVTIIEE